MKLSYCTFGTVRTAPQVRLELFQLTPKRAVPASKELSIRVVVVKKSTGKADLQRSDLQRSDLQRSDLHKELTAYPLRAAWF